MNLFKSLKKTETAVNASKSEVQSLQGTETGETAPATNGLQGQQPGNRIAAVMERMYRLVLSVDLDRNSCFLESGNPVFGNFTVPAAGEYDQLLPGLRTLPVEEGVKKRIASEFRREALIAAFAEGRGCISEMMTVNGTAYELRAERIPEIREDSNRYRCCIFLRNACSPADDGWTEERRRSFAEEGGFAGEELMVTGLFTGAYEINVEKNLLLPFRIEKGQLIRTGQKAGLRETIEGFIQNKTIEPDYADVYRHFLEKNWLKRRTLEGTFSAEVMLKRPGQLAYRWYEELILPVGSSFRIFRRDIDTVKRGRNQEKLEQDQQKYYDYNSMMLRTVASLVEFRNVETGPHIERVNELTRILLEDIGERSPQYDLTKPKIRLYTEASTMHDIGKITIPDAILNKPGQLTSEERKAMQVHTVNGSMIIDQMEEGENAELYTYCRDIAKHHHERYDGNGYPEGLKGEQISIGAQAVGMADAFDALCSKRSYKEAIAPEKSLEMILNGECGTFNPRLLESLKACFPRILEIYNRNKDSKPETEPEENQDKQQE